MSSARRVRISHTCAVLKGNQNHGAKGQPQYFCLTQSQVSSPGKFNISSTRKNFQLPPVCTAALWELGSGLQTVKSEAFSGYVGDLADQQDSIYQEPSKRHPLAKSVDTFDESCNYCCGSGIIHSFLFKSFSVCNLIGILNFKHRILIWTFLQKFTEFNFFCKQQQSEN